MRESVECGEYLHRAKRGGWFYRT